MIVFHVQILYWRHRKEVEKEAAHLKGKLNRFKLISAKFKEPSELILASRYFFFFFLICQTSFWRQRVSPKEHTYIYDNELLFVNLRWLSKRGFFHSLKPDLFNSHVWFQKSIDFN